MHNNPSLSEVHESIDTTLPRKGWRRILAYFGPAYLVSVGYMDPGNWATDLQGGAQFKCPFRHCASSRFGTGQSRNLPARR